MWKCNNCGEEITKDKYKNCWNCGTPKPAEQEEKKNIERIPPKLSVPPRREVFSENKALEVETSVKNEVKKETENVTKIEPKREPQSFPESGFLSQKEVVYERKTFSIIGKIISVILWLAAVSSIAYFANASYQKTTAYEKKIAENFQNFNNQKGQFVFPPIPVLRRGTVIEGNLRAKVLPLNVKTGETDPLFLTLPDDLRPSNSDEIKTLMWLGCENNPVGRYRDGTIGYQEKCTVYLVEKETKKFIGIQEYLGVMPALAKEREGEDAIGKVLPEKYIAYLREKQIESERGLIQSSTDSPDHHIYNKSEFVYALLLLGMLAAIGLGWLAFNLRFNRN